MFTSSYMPCPECGGSVHRSQADNHQCDPERLLDFQMFSLRQDVARFEHDLYRYLDTPTGRFEVWLAARDVLGESA